MSVTSLECFASLRFTVRSAAPVSCVSLLFPVRWVSREPRTGKTPKFQGVGRTTARTVGPGLLHMETHLSGYEAQPVSTGFHLQQPGISTFGDPGEKNGVTPLHSSCNFSCSTWENSDFGGESTFRRVFELAPREPLVPAQRFCSLVSQNDSRCCCPVRLSDHLTHLSDDKAGEGCLL